MFMPIIIDRKRDIMKLQENLIRLRKQKGLSQEDLAYHFSVSRQSVSKWESGLATPELERLLEIADFYKVSLDELVKGEATSYNTMTLSDEQIQRVVHKSMEYEYKSQWHIGSLPLIHIHFGRGIKKAKGIIAIGNVAIGVVSFGGLAIGLLSLGGLGIGGLVFGGLALGILAMGGMSLGYIAVGGLAIGIYACGGLAIGQTLAIGGKAIGQIAIGGSPSGRYTLVTKRQSLLEIISFLKSIPLHVPQWIIDILTIFA